MKEHVTDLLNSFVDGQLADAERRMVEAHVGKCQDCERELQDLKGLSALLARTERRPLPTGFHQRLELRRQREAQAKPAEERHLLPMPARGLAYGLSFAVVCFVAYDAFQQNALDRTAGMVLARDADALRYVDGRARRASSVEAAQGAAFEETAGAGAFGSGFGSASGSAAPAAAADGAPARKQVRAPGAPIGFAEPTLADEKAPASVVANKAEDALTNERLQSHLDGERKRMGITQIVPKGAGPDPADKLPPMSPAEARDYMQGMTEAFKRQRMAMENYSEPVALGAGSKPLLLKPRAQAVEGGAPIDAIAAANADHNAPAAPAPMLAQAPRDGGETRYVSRRLAPKGKSADRKLDRSGDLEASAGMAQAPVTSLPYVSAQAGEARGEEQAKSLSGPAAGRRSGALRGGAGGGAGGAGLAMNGLAAASGNASAAAEREAEKSSLAKKEAEAERRAPQRAEPEADMAQEAPRPAPAAAPKPGRGLPAASVARSAAELEALWRRLGKSGDLPAVDFSSEMIVAVSHGSPIEIVSVKTRRGGIVLECRPASGTGPGAAFRVVPRSDRPVTVELIP